MNRIALVIAALAWANPASGQVRIGLRGGALASSNLVRDSIVEAIAVRPGIAPSLGFVLETEVDGFWRLGVGFSTAWTRLSRHTAGGSAEIVPLTVWSPTASLGLPLGGPLGARMWFGAVAYDPRRPDGNLFAEGAPLLPMAGAGLNLERTLGNTVRYTVELGYDFHRFVTTSLQDQGFTGAQAVHRVTISITVSRLIL